MVNLVHTGGFLCCHFLTKLHATIPPKQSEMGMPHFLQSNLWKTFIGKYYMKTYVNMCHYHCFIFENILFLVDFLLVLLKINHIHSCILTESCSLSWPTDRHHGGKEWMAEGRDNRGNANREGSYNSSFCSLKSIRFQTITATIDQC